MDSEPLEKNRQPYHSQPSMDSFASYDAPPRYSELPDAANDFVHLGDNGRVAVDLNSNLYRTLSKLQYRKSSYIKGDGPPPESVYSEQRQNSICLNIVIQVVGSRGDVQPFLALGCELRKHGHRVRLATHPVFQDFVLKTGLEFFSIGGDPAELMAYMVKNPGLIPSLKSLRAGDIQTKRKMVAAMLERCWASCISPDPISGQPFVAEAIIANPPSFAHIHCAQALGVPVHLMFTMPWTSTVEFSHPLANIINKERSLASRESANYMSYLVVEWMTWQGLGDIVNSWRVGLGLEEVHFSEGPLLAETLKVPFTYCWSPSLVPKPKDWGHHIDVCGFFFRETPTYQPEPDLSSFLRSGDRPVYIGFGSIVIDDPAELTNMIMEAVEAAGVRAIISKGWSNLGAGCKSNPNVFFLGDCPHEWLFQHVSAVVHHGGAGTTACGLLNGKPTAIVPFFGDQPFWGDMVAAAGAGPSPIHHKNLNAGNLTEALRLCLREETSVAARGIAERMNSESGVRRAVASFHANLPLATMRCQIFPNQPATWVLKKGNKEIRLSKKAAGVLVAESRLNWKDLKRYEAKSTVIDLRRFDPLTATTSSLLTTGAGMVGSAVDIVAKPIQAFHGAKTATNVDATVPKQDESQEQEDHPTYGRSAALTLPATSTQREERSALATAVMGSAGGVGGFFKHFAKGMYLDMPMAVTEGMRNAPRLYGGEVYQPGPINDWTSGGVAAGRNFRHGIVEGIGGLVMSPIRGAQHGGAAGAFKGAGVGCLNMGTKVTSGFLGLVTFTGQGVYKSIYTATHRGVRDAIGVATRDESERSARMPEGVNDKDFVLQQYATLLGE